MTFEEREDKKFETFWENRDINEILPCPFCGEKMIQINKCSGKDGKFYYMYCEYCYASSGTSSRVDTALLNWQKRKKAAGIGI